MALPTTNLTLHVTADSIASVFTTFNGSGVPSGTPGDGSAVQVWEDNGDGISDVSLIVPTAGQEPVWRSTTPLMTMPCLDFDKNNSQMLRAYTQNKGAGKLASDFITTTDFTIIAAIYPESVDEAAPEAAGCIASDHALAFGLAVHGVLGLPRVSLFTNDFSGNTVVTAPITLGHTAIVVAQLNSGQLRVQVIDDNGVASYLRLYNGPGLGTVDGEFVIGVNPAGDAFYDGRIGEIAVWNAYLSGSTLTDAIAYFKSRWLPTSYYATPAGTSIKDSFTRANESPLSGGGNWSGPTMLGGNQMALVSNGATGQAGGGASYWAAASFPGAQECWATLKTLWLANDLAGSLYVDVQNPNSGSEGGYLCGAFQNSSDGYGAYIIARIDAGTISGVVFESLFDLVWSVGDKLLLRHDTDGRVAMYRLGVGDTEWQLLDVFVDTDYTSGYIGIGSDDNVVALDDVGGGTLVLTVPVADTGPARLIFKNRNA